jgi:hypothetical protein
MEFLGRTALVAALGLFLTGCPAVYPELGTATRKPAPGQPLDPPPPDNLHWLKFLGAKVPEKTRDGRTWGEVLGHLPDPYAKLIVNGEELFRTPVQSSTLEPTWPNGPKGNFKLDDKDKLRVELWDSNTINDRPIGVRELGHVSEDAKLEHVIRTDLEGGGEVSIAYEAAHAVLGLGLWYELRTDTYVITRTLVESPSDRAGVGKGDEVIRIGDKDTKAMSADEVRSQFNAIPMGGLAIVVRHPSGATANVTLKEGPIYPLYKEFQDLE